MKPAVANQMYAKELYRYKNIKKYESFFQSIKDTRGSLFHNMTYN